MKGRRIPVDKDFKYSGIWVNERMISVRQQIVFVAMFMLI
jgi:hypothetical protein